MSREKSATATMWSGIDLALRQGVQFVVSVILARLLTPADFGVAALVAFFASFGAALVQTGLTTALIQRRESSRAEESALFWWNVLASLAVGLAIVLAAPAIARLYGFPILVPLLAMAAMQILFSGFGVVQTALLSRSLRFDQLTKAGLASTILSGMLGIAAALMGAGVWALVLQLAALALINSLVLWWICPWRPAMHARFSTVRPLLRFGSAISLSGVLEVLYTQGFALVLGKLHGVRDLGLYNRAQATQLLPSNVIGSLVGRVALPIFASRGDDPEALRRGVRLANQLTMVVNVPAMVGLILLSEPIILVLFGEQWRPAAPLLSILALAGILYPLHIINLQLLLSLGHGGRLLRVEISKKLVGIAFLTVGSWFGMRGLAWAQALFSLVALLINARPTAQSVGYGMLRQLGDLLGIFAAAGVMGAALLLLAPLFVLGPVGILVVMVPAGAAVYITAGLLMNDPAFREARGMAAAMLANRRW